MALSREQQEVAQRALRRARQRGATARVRKALLLAGLTESQLQHDRYRQVGSGDRDSVGFLQQRPSQGWGPAGESVERDTDQFLDRALRLNQNFRGSAGQLAQAVQRSAFPERYDQRSGEAEAILRRLGGGSTSRPSSSSGPAPDASAVVAPAQSNGAQLAAVLLSAQQQRQPRPSMGLALPAAAAGPVMPVGAQQVMSQAPRESPGAALAQAMTAIKALGGQEPAEAPEDAEAPRAPRGKGARPARANVLELFWQGPGGINVKNGKRVPQGFVDGHDHHVHVAAPTEKGVLRFARIAQDMGLKVGEHPEFGGVGGGHVENSNHYARRAIDVTGDPRKLRAFARRIAAMAGAA